MEFGIRARVVMFDAGFEAVLGVVLILGVVFGNIDEREFPDPADDWVLAGFGFALIGFALALASAVSRDRVTDGLLRGLAAVNTAFALVLLLWVLVAGPFGVAAEVVVWVTIGALLLLALMQVQAVGLRRR